MIKILINGSTGKMGKVLAKTIKERKNVMVCGGVDTVKSEDIEFPQFTSFNDVNVTPDVIIDFSHPATLEPMLNYAIKNKIPAVLCTTGYSVNQVKFIKEASNKISIFYSANMSLGINLLVELSKKATCVFGEEFDIEIIEKHHNQKIDSPSGTAVMIAEDISKLMYDEPVFVYDRHSYRKPRNKNEIGIHSVRGGNIVGEHEVIFAGNDEIFKISHSAQSRSVFASGAINAAIYLTIQKPGLYQMSDMLE